MKKLAIILALLMVPFSAFALDTISDTDLNDVTGQAGVSIFLNTIRIEKSQWTSGYGDVETMGSEHWLLIQDEGSTKEISFLGSSTLDIDITSRTAFSAAVVAGAVPGVLTSDYARFANLTPSSTTPGITTLAPSIVSDTAVIISLPDAIQIADFGTTKSIYLANAIDTTRDGNVVGGSVGGTAELLIKTYSGGGTTTITGAGGAFANNNVHIGIMAHD